MDSFPENCLLRLTHSSLKIVTKLSTDDVTTVTRGERFREDNNNNNNNNNNNSNHNNNNNNNNTLIILYSCGAFRG